MTEKLLIAIVFVAIILLGALVLERVKYEMVQQADIIFCVPNNSTIFKIVVFDSSGNLTVVAGEGKSCLMVFTQTNIDN